MATRLYFHEATSGLSNLPTTRQSDPPGTLGASADAANVNRTMDRNVGSAHTWKNVSSVATTVNREYYFTRFVSPPLKAQVIDAETWTLCIQAAASTVAANHPVSGLDQSCFLYIALWRPGSGIIGTIVNGNSNADFDEPPNDNVWSVFIGTFSGSQLTAQPGDVIIIEVVSSINQADSTSRTIYFGYDGSDISTTSQASGLDNGLAAFLETPQDLVFVGEGPTEMTNEWTKTLNNKFITNI